MNPFLFRVLLFRIILDPGRLTMSVNDITVLLRDMGECLRQWRH